jgi:hypothetical protein
MFEKLSADPQVLYNKLVSGMEWINRYLHKRGHDAHIDAEIERFRAEVVGPLDEAWSKMTDPEKEAFRRRNPIKSSRGKIQPPVAQKNGVGRIVTW